MEPGYKERFIGVDVPQTGEKVLIQEERLKRSPAVSQEMGEPFGGELRLQRFRAQPPYNFLCLLYEIQASELPHIHKEKVTPIFQVKEGAGMAIHLHLVEQKTARHSQVDDEVPTS